MYCVIFGFVTYIKYIIIPDCLLTLVCPNVSNVYADYKSNFSGRC